MDSPLISFILQALNKSSRFLYRDYFELELQQSSRGNMVDFVQKSYRKCEEILTMELAKYGSRASFQIIPIDGKENLEHAIPFFGIVVVACKDNDPIPAAVVIDCPVLGETYYSEKGCGMWLKRHAHSSGTSSSTRLRVSSRKEKFIFLCNENSGEANDYITRIFGANSYSICLIAAGKADLANLSNIDPTLILAARLFMQESGGKIISENPLILSNGYSSILP